MSAKWNENHTMELYRGILELALTSRSQLYSRPGLSEVNGHGGDTINRKLQQALKELGRGMNVPNSLVMFNEELAKCSKRGGGGGGGSKTTPKKTSTKKEAGDVAPSSAKKRKVQHKEDGGEKLAKEEEEEDFWKG